MDSPWQQFILTFVPLFIVINALGILPFLLSIGVEIAEELSARCLN